MNEKIVIIKEHIPFKSREKCILPGDVGAFLKQLRLRVKNVMDTDERLREYRLHDVGIIRCRDGFEVKLYFEKRKGDVEAILAITEG